MQADRHLTAGVAWLACSSSSWSTASRADSSSSPPAYQGRLVLCLAGQFGSAKQQDAQVQTPPASHSWLLLCAATLEYASASSQDWFRRAMVPITAAKAAAMHSVADSAAAQQDGVGAWGRQHRCRGLLGGRGKGRGWSLSTNMQLHAGLLVGIQLHGKPCWAYKG